MSSRLQSHFQGGQTVLPPVPDCAQLSDRVWVVLGMNPGPFSLQGTNTYLVGTGPKRVLIDTGEGREDYIAVLKRGLEQSGASGLSEVVVTHWHPDHLGGVPSVLEAFGPVPVRKLMPPQADSMFDGEGGVDPSAVLSKVDVRPLSDGDVVTCEGATLRVMHTPGHANDHVVLYLEEESAMFTGDNVLGTGTPVFRDLPLYMASLKRMKAANPKVLFTSHGPVVRDGAAMIDEYISHRQARIDQVRSTLAAASGDWRSAEQLTRVIYSQHPERLIPAATVNTVQALRVLTSEGTAACDAPAHTPAKQLTSARWRYVAQ
eukprot:TRINITY_DN3749_c0_g1_i2.p1 TRINITY_DN3749_c0_g1~~TRINITY_DN3749_c0_g1_i2.p1  ORF type:complete len:337 (+),score=91.25 TRINITY_DN3749_c0_g1_i2:60-1013(+)